MFFPGSRQKVIQVFWSQPEHIQKLKEPESYKLSLQEGGYELPTIACVKTLKERHRETKTYNSE